MKPGKKFFKKSSIATRILLVVLTLCLLISFAVALGQIWMNFRYQKANILQDLGDIEIAFEEGLAVGLWDLDEKALKASVKGMLKIPTIVGIIIINAEKTPIVVGGIVTKQKRSGNVGLHVSLSGLSDDEKTIHGDEPYKFELFEHHFPIIYNDKDRNILLGHVTIFSNSSVIYRRMKVELVMVAVSVGLTLLVFFLSLLWTVNRYLRRPLGILTKATASISLDNLGEFSVDTGASGHDEIKQLAQTMTSMVGDLHDSVLKQKKSEELYRSLFEDNPSMYFKINEDGIVLSVNQFGAEQLGYTVDKLVGKSVLEVFYPDDRDAVQQCLANCLENPGQVAYWEFRKIRNDGSLMWVKENARVVVETDGTRVALIVCDDITDRKGAELALRKSEKKYRTLFEKTSDAIFIVDAKTGRYIDANESALKLTRRNRSELYQLTTLDVSPGGADKRLQKLDKTKTIQDLGQTVYVRPDGEQRITKLNAINFGEDTFIVIARDITEELKLNERLMQSQKMEAIGTLAGGIAHDFNNILSAIIGYSELSLSKLEPGTWIHENLSKVLKAGERASTLVKQILTFSRQSEREVLPVQIELVVKEVIKFIRATLPTTIEIRQNMKDNPTVMADLTQVHQIIMNLCTNAGHSMEDKGGTLEIGLESLELDSKFMESHPGLQPGKHVKLTVGDTGTGIPPEKLDLIFDPYFTTKEKGKGTGLGLATVHGIVKSHGGAITVESQVGKGTTFEVYLPLAVDSSETKKDSETQLISGKDQILLVDDEPDIIEVGKEILEKLGYTVTATDKADKALEIFANQPDRFDLVISDMTMPKMTGDKLAGELMKIRSDIPILLCTGFSEQMSEERAASLGIKGYLMKPVTLKSLSHGVRKVLDKKLS